MREVYVVGAGMTKFGQLFGKGVREMAEEAGVGALKDAGAKPKDIQAAYVGSVGMSSDAPMMIGQICMEQAGIVGVPVTRVENACGSGSNAFRLAWMDVALGTNDVAMAMGIENMTMPSMGMAKSAGTLGGGDSMMEGSMGLFPPGIFGMIARVYLERYDASREDLARVSVKSHKFGAMNPKAHYQKEVSLEAVLNAKPIADPLGTLDCCPVSDGAAAAILCSKDALKKFTGKPIQVIGSAMTSGSYPDNDDLRADTTVRAAREAYKMAGIGPEDLSFCEVHDCFTMAEIMDYEDLGLCKLGDGWKFIREGQSDLGGKTPVNVSGGLLSKGHPLGATGVAQVYEVVQQLRGEAGGRQVENAKIALTHNGGGFRHGDIGAVMVHIFKKVD